MHLRGLDLNLLLALDAVLEHKNVSQAARQLKISQSGLSAALRRLRLYFDDPLLELVGRHMVPTALGASLAEPVRDILNQTRSLVETRPAFDPLEVKRTFGIVASDYVATVFLADVLAQIASEAPGAAVDIRRQEDVPASPLERGDIDLLIVPERFIAAKHPSQPLFDERYVCVSWDENPFTQEGLPVETFMALGHVAGRLGSVGAGFDERFFGSLDQPRRIEVYVSAYNLVPQFVVGTQRIATMHERLARVAARSFPLRIQPLPFDMPTITETMQWHRFQDRDPALTWFRGRLAAYARTMGGYDHQK